MLLKNVPIPQGSTLEFMNGNKVVMEATDTLTASSDTNASLDVALTVWRSPDMALTKITKGVIKPNENYDTHNINSTGIITATQFHGDGSNLTGISRSFCSYCLVVQLKLRQYLLVLLLLVILMYLVV